MLILSRKVGESIRIGRVVEITITEIHEGKIRIGITAPRWVKVLRSELPEDPPASHAKPLSSHAESLSSHAESRGRGGVCALPSALCPLPTAEVSA